MTTSPTGVASAVKVGNMVVINFPTITGTSNATTFTLTGLPSRLYPATTPRRVVVQINDNTGNVTYGMADIGTSGTITLYKDPQGNVWTSSGTKGIYFSSASYTI